jgi:hypothetical protein
MHLTSQTLAVQLDLFVNQVIGDIQVGANGLHVIMLIECFE